MVFQGTISEVICDKKVAIKGQISHFFKVVFTFSADPSNQLLVYFEDEQADMLSTIHSFGHLLHRPARVDLTFVVVPPSSLSDVSQSVTLGNWLRFVNPINISNEKTAA